MRTQVQCLEIDGKITNLIAANPSGVESHEGYDDVKQTELHNRLQHLQIVASHELTNYVILQKIFHVTVPALSISYVFLYLEWLMEGNKEKINKLKQTQEKELCMTSEYGRA